MKYLLYLFVFLLFAINVKAQNIFEYSYSTEVNFTVYDKTNNTLQKVESFSNNLLSTPETFCQAYFFATDSNWLKKLYVDPNNAPALSESHFKNIKKTKSSNISLTLFHELEFTYNSYKYCYIMFIANIKGVDFSFPTILSLININGDWHIDDIANQQYIRNCLLMYKSSVLSKLIESKNISDVPVINNSLRDVIVDNELDFNILSNKINTLLEDEMNNLTISQDNKCPFPEDLYQKELVNKKVRLTSVMNGIEIFQYDEDESKKEPGLISQLKQNNDSIILRERLNIKYFDNSIAIVKYYAINNGNKKLEVKRIDKGKISFNPIEEIMDLFKNYNSNLFLDLLPKMDKTNDSELYKETRGNYDMLNITKLYNIYKTNKSLLSRYAED